MKLIDLLVQELPKIGGWPEGALTMAQDDGGYVYSYKCNKPYRYGPMWRSASGDSLLECILRDAYLADDASETFINREQYEEALAAAQQPAWSGEGLPPVGMHCEIVDPDGALMYGQGESGEVVAHVEDTAVIRMSYGLGCFEARCLRPARSEADKKRDAAIEKITDAICGEIPDTGMATAAKYAARAYDAVAAGKVPGLRLE